MDLFSKITVSHFIWYLMPGLAGILFVCFPLLVFCPTVIEKAIHAIGPVGLVLLGIILGFSLDGLRLYRSKHKYNDIKRAFFNELQRIVGKAIDPYLIQTNIVEIAKEKGVSGISFHHAIWIMHGHFSIMCYVQSAFWFVAGFSILLLPPKSNLIFGFFRLSNDATSIMCYIISSFIGIIGYRFMKISNEDQETTNNMFIDFAKQYKTELKSKLNIT
jgi:hypothetical protein